MALEKKRIGLLLASIHTGISQEMWAGFIRAAAAEDASLFIFPGGRLNARKNFEDLRNPVYYLVNEENLDGCISWSSTIQYTQAQEEFEVFHSGFGSLPYVTLGIKSPGHPCVDYDAYNGMKTLVSHCINVHGARKIAFLRGPTFHQSAQARLDGYYDVLKEAGLLPANISGKGKIGFSPLVTDPFDWEAGEAAAAQLFEQRALVPGRDFDTLIGSSDLMAVGAINYFKRRGYHVPVDYHAAGFNNSEVSRITESFLSTVLMPYAEMSKESFKILMGIMGKKKLKSDTDVLLNCELIIRESCGCAYPGRESSQTPVFEHKIKNTEDVLLKMARDYFKIKPNKTNDLLRQVVHALLHETKDKFLNIFKKAIVDFFKAGREPDNLFKFIDDVKTLTFNLSEKINAYEPELYRIIFQIREQLNAQNRYETEKWNTVLNSLKCDLLGTRDRFSLVQNLARYLPEIGINTVAIVLYSDEKTSIFAGGFSSEGNSHLNDQRFPSQFLVPPSLKSQYSDGIFLVQPLFIDNRSLGYFVHNVPMNGGVIFEELRSVISYVLKGILLLEETVCAKRIAEQAEQAKTEFFRTLEAEVGSIIDFTQVKVDELSLQKNVFDIEKLLPEIGAFPLLVGDTTRLAQCFSLIREQYGENEYSAAAEYSAVLTYGGLCITFPNKKSEKTKGSKTGTERQLNLLLAERIILMHGGVFSSNRDRCTITLPWSTLTGHEVSKNPVNSRDNILVLSDPASLPDDFFTLPQVRDTEKVLSGKIAFIT
jgi:DNA-binding LacI/PurR family transcriptional regulator